MPLQMLHEKMPVPTEVPTLSAERPNGPDVADESVHSRHESIPNTWALLFFIFFQCQEARW